MVKFGSDQPEGSLGSIIGMCVSGQPEGTVRYYCGNFWIKPA